MTTLRPYQQTDWLQTESSESTSLQGDFHVKIFQQRAEVAGSQEQDQGFGTSSTVLSKKSNRATRLSKTFQPFALEDWIKSSGASLRSGMTRNGIVYPLPPLARLTDGIASGLWPTPQASDHRDRGCLEDPSVQRRIRIGKQIGLSVAVKKVRGRGTLNPTWVEWLMGFPLGWTDLKPSEMPLSHKSQKSSVKR